MKVKIKEFAINMDVKSKGIEFEIRSADGASQLGDVVLTNTGLVWCKGKTDVKNGVKVSWNEFIGWMESDED